MPWDLLGIAGLVVAWVVVVRWVFPRLGIQS